MKVLDVLAALDSISKSAAVHQQRQIRALVAKVPTAQQQKLESLLRQDPSKMRSSALEIVHILCVDEMKEGKLSETDQAMVSLHIDAGR